MSTRILPIMGQTVIVLSSCVVCSASLMAQPQRAFCSVKGNDANPASQTHPVRTLQAAIDAVAPGGEVVPLDSAGYGTVTITKSVSITTPPGIVASITSRSGPGILVNAGANDLVSLRGLSLTSRGGNHGIQHDSGGTLIIERVSISGFSSSGVRSVADGIVVIRDSTISQCGLDGISLNSADLSAVLIRVTSAQNSSSGVYASESMVSLKDCVVAGNSGTGLFAADDARVLVEKSEVVRNGIGLDANFGCLLVSNTTISSNTTGIGSLGMVMGVISRGNNTLEDNETNGDFADTFPPQ